MLLFLVKKSRIDIDNVTRELSKANDGVNHVVFNESLHVIKKILDTKCFG